MSLKTNVNILGKDYFVPLTMAFPFILLHLYYLTTGLKETNFKRFILSMSILFFIMLIHPPSAVVLLIPTAIEILINKNVVKKLSKTEKNILAGILFVGTVFVIVIVWRGSISKTVMYLLNQIYFEKGWGKLEITYFIPFVYGVISTLLALYAMKKEYNGNLRYFVYLSFLTLGITALFNTKNFSLIIPYQRAIHYVLLSLIPLSAVAVTSLLKEKHLKNKTNIVLIIFIVFIIGNLNSYPLFDKYSKYESSVIYKEDYDALVWLRTNKGENNLIISPYTMTSSIYPISKNRVVSIIPSQFSGGNISLNIEFYGNYSCQKMGEVVKENKIDYIYSRVPIYCNEFKNIYLEKNSFFYIANN